MWKYINSNELYHAWPKGYKRGPDGTPLGYVSKDSQYNDKERGTVGKISDNINTFKPKSTNYKVNNSGYKVNISNKKEKPPYEVVPINKNEVVPINKNEVVPINKNEVVPINKNKEEPEIEKINPTLDNIFDSTNENTTKKGKEKVDNMFKNEKVDFDFTTEKGKKRVNDLINKIRKENAEKEQLAKEKAAKEKDESWDLSDEEINEIIKEEVAKEKAEKERLAKEKAAKEKAEKERLAKEKAAKEKAEKERLAKEKAEKEQLAKEKAAKEKAEKEKASKEKAEKEKVSKEKTEKEKTVKEKITPDKIKELENKDLADKYESEAKKRDLGLEMQSIKNNQEQQKLDAATADEKRKAKDFEDRKAREAYLDELNRYSNASNNFGTAGSRLGSAGDTVSKIRVQEKEKLDLSQFSSEELKRRIERNRLEQEYNDRFAPETRVSKGKRLVTNILYGSSALSNFAGSIASIMGAIKSFKTLSDYKNK